MRQTNLFIVAIPLLSLAVISAQATEPFEASWESLDKYECPEWFRDAKIGIFVCWNLHSVMGIDGWYARNMYIEGHETYNHHVKTYGHPSKFGFKDFIPMWKGEKFDADDLVRRFKDAGAKYIVPIATYHDNFDCWDSKHHKWNSVNMGPKKDIIGLWHKATIKHGLRFGVTTHLVRSYSWFQTSHDSDKQGEMKGVPYDGADPKYNDFYHATHGDYARTSPKNAPPQWKQQWTDRIKDLCEQHQPDLLYFDGGLPFGDDYGLTGRKLVAWYYNQNMKWHDGKLEAVLNIKKWNSGHGPFRDGMCVRDMEQGLLDGIQHNPWQNDTTVSKWFYQPEIPLRSVNSVVDMLIDIVSKNGNLLLNIPPKPDGTLDEPSKKFLKELGQWMKINSQAIYATRPWTTYGEGPTAIQGGAFGDHKLGLTAKDIRFTRSKDGKTVYALLMDWPGDAAVVGIESLGRNNHQRRIKSVHLMGHNGPLKWTQSSKVLTVHMPHTKPCNHAYALMIEVQNE